MKRQKFLKRQIFEATIIFKATKILMEQKVLKQKIFQAAKFSKKEIQLIVLQYHLILADKYKECIIVPRLSMYQTTERESYNTIQGKPNKKLCLPMPC